MPGTLGLRIWNAVLNQFVAGAMRRTVVAGPPEATAIGNILVQAMGSGALADLNEGREMVRNSFPVTVVEPQAGVDREAPYQRFRKLV